MLTEPAIAVQTEAVVGGKPTAPVSVFSLIAPGMSVAFAFWVAGEVAQTLHREKDEGTLRRLLSAPVSRLEIIAGYILAYTAVVFLQVVVLFAAAGVIFGMPLGESPAGIILVAVALGMTVSAFGLMMGSPARSGKQADSIVFVLGFILGGLSGALIMTWPPFYRAEGFMGTLARLTPHGPALEGYTRLLVERGGDHGRAGAGRHTAAVHAGLRRHRRAPHPPALGIGGSRRTDCVHRWAGTTTGCIRSRNRTAWSGTPSTSDGPPGRPAFSAGAKSDRNCCQERPHLDKGLLTRQLGRRRQPERRWVSAIGYPDRHAVQADLVVRLQAE
jgi:hypothetical protein